jgi:murein DD-endopeptidase MepM/ murein hydrolase activator NlpD
VKWWNGNSFYVSDPSQDTRDQQFGTTFTNAPGTIIPSLAPGTVSQIYTASTGTPIVEITHKYGFTTHHLHWSEVLVDVGQKVSRGQPVAKVGMVGNASFYHDNVQLVQLSGVSLIQAFESLIQFSKRAKLNAVRF